MAVLVRDARTFPEDAKAGLRVAVGRRLSARSSLPAGEAGCRPEEERLLFGSGTRRSLRSFLSVALTGKRAEIPFLLSSSKAAAPLATPHYDIEVRGKADSNRGRGTHHPRAPPTTPRPLNKNMSRRARQTNTAVGLFLLAATAAAAAAAATSSGGVAAFAFFPGRLPKGVTARGSTDTGGTSHFLQHFGVTILGSAQGISSGLVVGRRSRSVVSVGNISSFNGRSSWCSSSSSSSRRRRTSGISSGCKKSRTSSSERGRSRASSWVATRMSDAETTAETMVGWSSLLFDTRPKADR